MRDYLIKICTDKRFDQTVMFLIMLNTLILALKWYDNPESMEEILEILNQVFAAVFLLEAVVKIFAFRVEYFKDGWNVFDFAIVVGTLAGTIINLSSSVKAGSSFTIVRSFRIGRIFRLIKRYKVLRQSFNTLILTIPALGNVGGLLFLFLYLYSILGVFLFAKVKLQNSLDIHANF